MAEEIDDAELARFAESQGGRFPDPQYCPGLQWVMGSKQGSAGPKEDGEEAPQMKGLESASGVVLVGDAIHAFPPDLGQVWSFTEC